MAFAPEAETEELGRAVRVAEGSADRSAVVGSPGNAAMKTTTGSSEWRGEVYLDEAGEAESAVVVASRKKSVVDGLTGTVSRFLGANNSSSRPPSRSDLHRDDSSGPPPVLPTRTTDSYILTEEQRQLNEPPRVPTSPRPSQSDIQPPAHLTAAGRPLSTGVPMEFSSLQSDTGRAVTPTTPGAGNSNTLPVPGKHAESPNAHSNSSSSVVSNTKRVFRNLVPGTRRNQRTTGGAPVISSPVGMDSNEQKVPPQPTHTSSAVIVPVFSDDMGFKNRVPRPKGPRSMPANWRSFG